MKTNLLVLTLILLAPCTEAQIPLWQGKGRVAISSDGNEHDNDDWAATPMSLALIAAKGLQNQLAVYTYSDHIWGSNIDHPTSKEGLTAYEQMKVSALEGAKWFGFKKSQFICAVDDPEASYEAMAKAINASAADNPLFILGAGPMQVIGEGLRRSNFDKRQYVTVISHSKWNDKHGAQGQKNEPNHNGWTFDKMKNAFENSHKGGVTFVHIANQNGNDEFEGLNAKRQLYEWLKTSPSKDDNNYKKGAWNWLYTRLKSCLKNGSNFDPSDAGMLVFLFTGIEHTNPDLVREIMENPK